ncbi:MAG: AraC family transcriptional regulator [Bacteroidaceae bacterium]|nr:AraC family transcriptional regulator [Bacteroidaceae bacterium]
MKNSGIKMHPLDQLRSKIEKEELVVIDNVNEVPRLDNDVYVSPHLVVSLCHEGHLRVKYDSNSVDYHSHEVALVMPNHSLETLEVSPDYRATLIVVSGHLLEQMRQHVIYRNFLTYHKTPAFRLTDEQYEAMMHFIGLLQSTCAIKGNRRQSIVLHMLEIMCMIVDEFRQQNTPDEQEGKAAPVFVRFYDALTEHYKESREVQFYANKLCLSPKYFGTIIRQETGTSVSRWIANYIILQAKSLLAHRRSMSIQMVSRELGFSDQATFARYFKTYTGITPKDYRTQQR